MLVMTNVSVKITLEQQLKLKDERLRITKTTIQGHVDEIKNRGKTLGLLQLLTFPLLFFGWFWALWSSISIYKGSKCPDNKVWRPS